MSLLVPEQLEIKIRRAGPLQQGYCSLCGSLFRIPRVTTVLQDGPVPLGYLCELCLLLGPRVAATKVEERAEVLRGSIEKARQAMSVIQWPCVTAAVRKRIERYETLAAGLKEMPWWPMRRQAL
jgi:hypothetical protein